MMLRVQNERMAGGYIPSTREFHMDEKKTAEKKHYVKPKIACEREIEALTSICETGGNNTMTVRPSIIDAAKSVR